MGLAFPSFLIRSTNMDRRIEFQDNDVVLQRTVSAILIGLVIGVMIGLLTSLGRL